jgi:hypothetical protein
MSLRIPLTKDQTLQVEFHEIERRLRKLERSLGQPVGATTVFVGGGTAVPRPTSGTDLSGVTARLDALEAIVSTLGTVTEPVDFKAVGAYSANGLVPTPGTSEPPDGVADHVLKEDATWGFPFRGLVEVATDGTGESDVVNIHAGLHVGSIQAADIVCSNIYGTLSPMGYLACCDDELAFV